MHPGTVPLHPYKIASPWIQPKPHRLSSNPGFLTFFLADQPVVDHVLHSIHHGGHTVGRDLPDVVSGNVRVCADHVQHLVPLVVFSAFQN